MEYSTSYNFQKLIRGILQDMALTKMSNVLTESQKKDIKKDLDFALKKFSETMDCIKENSTSNIFM